MNGLVWVAHTLELAALLAWVTVVVGAFRIFRWWWRSPVLTQRDREAMYLAHQTALVCARRACPQQVRAAA